jgi:hypothetical protein
MTAREMHVQKRSLLPSYTEYFLTDWTVATSAFQVLSAYCKPGH